MKSLRTKLLTSILLILLITQSISILWLWHESQELIELISAKSTITDQQIRKNIDDEINEEIRETVAALFLPAATSIGLAILMIFVTVTYLTKPLKKLTQQIEQRSPYNLKPLDLETEKNSSDVFLVTQTVNNLLARLEEGFEGERRFTADVAHELRTPLAGVRLNLELMLQKGIPEAQALIDRIDQMMVSTEHLLQLSRAGQKLQEGLAERFDLIAQVITPTQLEWDDDVTSPYPLIVETPPQAIITGDSGLIYLLLRNLLENVRIYAQQGSQALIRVTQESNGILLEVIDEGPGVAEEKIPVLTQRYTRLDQTIKGNGLGLNIVNRIIQVHHAHLNICNRKDRSGLHISVYFPGDKI